MKECKKCGKEFAPKHHRDVFCSAECKVSYLSEYNIKKQKEYRQKRKQNLIDNLPERKCLSCGVMYKPERLNQATCSEECATNRLKEQMKQANLKYRELRKGENNE